MRRIAVAIAVLLAATACSASGDDTTTTTVPAGAASGTTTTTVAVTTTTVAGPETTTTTTVAAGSDLASCVVGTWELDSDAFLAAVTEAAADEAGDVGEFTFGGGSYRLTVGGDGTFIDERVDWTLLVVSDFGDLSVTINDRNEGTYTLEGDVLSTTIDMGEAPEVTFLVDGVPVEFPAGTSPVQPPAAEFTGATVTCAGDAMSAFFDGFTSEWLRVS